MLKRFPGISRIDSGITHGWFVRVYRNGKTHSQFFADKRCGGKGKALKLALDGHSKLVQSLGPKTPSPRVRSGKSKNSTGILGVNRFLRKNGRGSLVDCFVVSYRPEPNLPRQRVFSVAKWGEKQAFDLAVKFRRQMERKILKGVKP